MEELIRTILLGNAGVSALVGGRVDWGQRPQSDALPAVSLFTVSAFDDPHLGGTDCLTRARVQANCWGMTYGSAKGLSRAVVTALNGYSSAKFSGVFHDGTRDLENEGASDPQRLFGVSLDFSLHYRG